MNLVTGLLPPAALLLLLLLLATRIGIAQFERRFPPAGAFVEAAGTRFRVVHVPAGTGVDLPPFVFIHGASANLNDQMLPLRPLLEGRTEMLFFDRPGHGWSERGPATNATPAGQADAVAALMDRLGMRDAVIVSHSFGGSIAAAFALAHPEKTRGLVFLSPATHPWPGGATTFYNRLAAAPVIGRAFTEAIVPLAGPMLLDTATRCVFAPNPVPENYLDRVGIALVLRPSAFRANAVDTAGLYEHVLAAQPRYRAIRAPTIVITGDSDTVVYEELHAGGLERDLPDVEVVWVKNLGHKPDWVAPGLVVAAVEKLAGRPRDLAAVAREVEARIAGDRSGADLCVDEPVPAGEGPPQP